MIAVKDVNNATDILPGHQLSLDINDGQFGCLIIYPRISLFACFILCLEIYDRKFGCFSIIIEWPGQCEADVVMKRFIDIIKTNDASKFRSTVGMLGEPQ